MVLYNFKKIQVVPSSTEFIDIVLTRTQRKTPTVVHPGYAISRIRSFYMRKVKFTQATFHDRLTQILEDFPKINDIHPFYASLINVLYDKDHYKLALGQLNIARSLIDNLSRDYVRMLKFGQNLFQCKELKTAALGRMCTIMRKHKQSLAYLEEVRKHLSRLPSIDPTARTLIVTGYPNVGKSSFVNKVTRADVEEAPYPFTTKSLFVGHMDYRWVRWQVIDTPGILDHPLEQRNAIEMQAITALAHLQCAVLFFLDLSQSGGYTLEKQLDLFESIRPVFTGKPLVVVANKIDVAPLEKVDKSIKDRIDSLVKETGALLLPMSNFSGDGVIQVRNKSCDALLALRVDKKERGNKLKQIANRVTVTMPQKRDGKVRPVSIPPRVLAQRQARAAAALAAAKSGGGDGDGAGAGGASGGAAASAGGAGGGAGAADVALIIDEDGVDWGAHKELEPDQYKRYVVPEIMNGKNIADFIDKDVMAKLQALERVEAEEMKALQAQQAAEAAMASSDEDPDEAELADEIRAKRMIMKKASRREKGKNRPTLPRKAKRKPASEFAAHLESLGIRTDTAVDHAVANTRQRGRSVITKKRRRRDDDDDSMDGGSGGGDASGTRRSLSVRRSMSQPRKQGDGLKNMEQRVRATKAARKSQNSIAMQGRKGEADRFIGTKMPKHLFSGKRGIGKTDRR